MSPKNPCDLTTMTGVEVWDVRCGQPERPRRFLGNAKRDLERRHLRRRDESCQSHVEQRLEGLIGPAGPVIKIGGILKRCLMISKVRGGNTWTHNAMTLMP